MIGNFSRSAVISSLAAGLLVAALPVGSARGAWDPGAIAAEDTVTLSTRCPDEEEHSFPVWLVVVDDHVYVRLGARAARRIECNVSKPRLRIKLGGQGFQVTGTPAPEEAGRVADAMADKYATDWFIRWFPHPLTLRLVPDP